MPTTVFLRLRLHDIVLTYSRNSEIRLEGPPCMEPRANRTQADAFHAGFQEFLENVLVPDCLLYLKWDHTFKLDIVLHQRSSCRRRTKSTVDYGLRITI